VLLAKGTGELLGYTIQGCCYCDHPVLPNHYHQDRLQQSLQPKLPTPPYPHNCNGTTTIRSLIPPKPLTSSPLLLYLYHRHHQKPVQNMILHIPLTNQIVKGNYNIFQCSMRRVNFTNSRQRQSRPIKRVYILSCQ